MEKRVDYSALSRTGRVRIKNQDNLYCSSSFLLDEVNDGLSELLSGSRLVNKGCLFAVFDGMGGEKAGETAAYLAAECMSRMDVRSCVLKKTLFPKQFFTSYCRQANQEIDEYRRSNHFHTVGTTIASVMILRHVVVACNVGDSRIYCFSNQELKQISTDHAERQTVGGQALTQFLGIPTEEMMIEPAICSLPYHSGDQYLVCTDGVWNSVDDRMLRDIFIRGKSIQEKMESIFDMVSESGERDNATAILIELH